MSDKTRNDFFEYLKWRGDLTFEQSPLNPVDAVIFCDIAYLNFRGILKDDFNSPLTLLECATRFLSEDFENRKELGLLINPKTVDLFFECAKTERFKNVMMTGFADKYNVTQEEQFSAVTFSVENLSKRSNFFYVAFRGTDDTIVGWKEDFNLAFKENIPAQRDARLYLDKAVRHFKKTPFYVGGHSKGGNLAIFAAANLQKNLQKNLVSVFNFDGPGFSEETLKKENFAALSSKTENFFPKGSIVGMLFEHYDRYSVIESDGFLVMQHDPFTWKISGANFELADGLEKSSAFFNSTFNQWFVGLSEERREEFVETIFDVLDSTKAETNSELAENWFKNSGKIIKAFANLDKEIRSSAVDTATQFIKLATENKISQFKLKK